MFVGMLKFPTSVERRRTLSAAQLWRLSLRAAPEGLRFTPGTLGKLELLGPGTHSVGSSMGRDRKVESLASEDTGAFIWTEFNIRAWWSNSAFAHHTSPALFINSSCFLFLPLHLKSDLCFSLQTLPFCCHSHLLTLSPLELNPGSL